MNTDSTPSVNLADQLVAQAERYAQEAMKSLPHSRAEMETEVLDEAREQLRILLQTQFLFPQLSDWQHGLLVALYWERRTLTELVNVPHQMVPASLQTQAERVTGSVEQSFMTLVRQIRDLVPYRSFSAAQRTLFEREYVCIPFSESPG